MEKIAKKKKKIKKITIEKNVMNKNKIQIKKKTNTPPKDLDKIWKKLIRLEDRWSKSWKKIDKIDDNIRDLISETRVIKMLQSDTDKVWQFTHGLHQNFEKMNSKLNSLTRKNAEMLQTWEDDVKTTHAKVNKFEDDMKSVQRLPKFYEDVNEKVAELEKQYNVIASDAVERLKELEEVTKPERMKLEKLTDLDTVRDQVESIRKSMLTFNKMWADYKREIDEKLGLRPSQTITATSAISPGVEDEVKSLRDMMNKVSLENEQIKKMARDIRVSQLEVPERTVVTDLSSRLNTVEKKITEVEEELSRFLKNKPVIME